MIKATVLLGALALTGCAGVYGSLVMHHPNGPEVSCHQPGVTYVGMSGGNDEQVLRVIEERECVQKMAAQGYECDSDLCRRMAGPRPAAQSSR
jgi:hypothetical protein